MQLNELNLIGWILSRRSPYQPGASVIFEVRYHSPFDKPLVPKRRNELKNTSTISWKTRRYCSLNRLYNRPKLRLLILPFGPYHLHIECTRCIRSSGRAIGRSIAIISALTTLEDTERFLQRRERILRCRTSFRAFCRERKKTYRKKTWPREKRRKKDSRAAVRAGVAAGTATYYVNIVHLLRYTPHRLCYCSRWFCARMRPSRSNHSRKRAEITGRNFIAREFYFISFFCFFFFFFPSNRLVCKTPLFP